MGEISTAQRLVEVDVNELPTLRCHVFDKDDDSNYHIDYMTEAAKLRAMNYQITRPKRLDVKIVTSKSF